MKRKLSRREELYGKKQNDDFGCLLMFLGGPLPFRLLSILFVSFVIILFQNFFPMMIANRTQKMFISVTIRGRERGCGLGIILIASRSLRDPTNQENETGCGRLGGKMER